MTCSPWPGIFQGFDQRPGQQLIPNGRPAEPVSGAAEGRISPRKDAVGAVIAEAAQFDCPFAGQGDARSPRLRANRSLLA